MAEDAGGGHFSPVIVYVAGWLTRNAFKNSNALRVTQPATYFQFKNMLQVTQPATYFYFENTLRVM